MTERLEVGKESKQARTCWRIISPSQEARKGGHVCKGEDSPVSWAERPLPLALAPENDHATLPGQASFVQCRRTGVIVHKKRETGTKGQLQRNVCAWAVKKSCRGFQKNFTTVYRLIKGGGLCYTCFHQFLD